MFYTIYQTTNLTNGKVYVGKHITKDPADDYLGSGKTLKAAILKYGRDKFTKEVLFVFDTEEEMDLKEKELVTEEFCARQDTYNICEGGKGGFSHINANGLGITPEQKNAARNFVLTICHPIVNANTPERNAKKREAFRLATIARKIKYPKGTFSRERGKGHTLLAREKIGLANSAHQIGAGNSQFGTIWITNGVVSQKIKAETPIPEGWKRGRSSRTNMLL